MLLVAIQDRKARIEPGYGLEPILPDALAGRVLDEQLFPAFRQGHYVRGITQAVNRIAEIIERGQPASPQDRQATRAVHSDAPFAVVILTLFFGPACAILGVGIGPRQLAPLFFGCVVLIGVCASAARRCLPLGYMPESVSGCRSWSGRLHFLAAG